MNNKKRIVSTLAISLGLLLIILSLSITYKNILIENKAHQVSQDTIYKLDNIMSSEIAMGNSYLRHLDKSPVDNTILIDGKEYIGKLIIDKLNLELPVLANFSYNDLSYAPSKYMGTIHGGNLIIAGHNYVYHFGKLSLLSTGDKITLIDVDGNEINYEIDSKETLHENESDKLISTDYDLTLFTCTIEQLNRTVIRCNKIE